MADVCERCGREATERRVEVKALRGGGKVVARHEAVLDLCEPCAVAFDAHELAERVVARDESGGAAQAEGAPVRGQPPLVRGIALDDDRSRDLAKVWERVLGVCRVVQGVGVDEVRALLAEYDRTEALMPVVDPTGYRKIVANLAQHREVAEAFLSFRETIAKYERAE